MIYTDGVHIVSDIGLTELHAWCHSMNIPRYCFHNPRKKHKPHYDIITSAAKSYVNYSIKQGFIKLVTSRQIVIICNKAYKPLVVNIAKDKCEVYIGRAGHGESGYFGNPFYRHPGDQPGDAVKKFRVYFYKRLKTDIEYKNRILALKGKVLGCFCKPRPCHGDVIIDYLKTQ